MATGGGRRSVWLGLLLTVALSGSVFAAAEPTPAADRAASPSPARPAGHGGEALAEIDPADATDCRHPLKGASQGTASTVVLKLDPETIWRPRGGEVRFFFEGSGIMVRNVQVCFAWSPVDGGAQTGLYDTSPLVRAITNAEGKIEYGAIVPGLKPAHRGWFGGIVGHPEVRLTGLGIVPLADMQVLARVDIPAQGLTTQTVAVAAVLPVGVTSVWLSVTLVVAFFVLLLLAIRVFSERRDLPKTNPVLRVIATRDGYGSLSQFQIMLWTLLIGAGAIYVMALSGNLIGITNGALVLLGIAGGASLLARAKPRPSTDPSASADPGAGATGLGKDQAASPPASPGPAPSPPVVLKRIPQWSDMVVVENGGDEIDVTRLQMLIFTVISAAFVAIKLLTSYEIPEIPEGFLLLMGISNGVYVSGKHIGS
jgi:hypothetical protein